ncbi:MAG TPA: Uma2 family endonuclease [Pirellulaceae bacterium]|nr:Uma2 family endonuclease [Pirellulaceae bacterium]
MVAQPRFRFSVKQYDRMIDLGILQENDPVELICGEILVKETESNRHWAAIRRFTSYLAVPVMELALYSVRNPVCFSDSETEPDVALLRLKDDYYASGKPSPSDVLLLIEVADTSLEFDREDKLPIYAEAGIREYWIVNLPDDVIEVYRDPAGKSYRGQTVVRRGDSLTLLALPDVTIAVSDILP